MKNSTVLATTLAAASSLAAFAQTPPAAKESVAAMDQKVTALSGPMAPGPVPAGALVAPREVTLSFDGTSKDSDLITIEHSNTVEIKATLKNVSDKNVTIVGTGPNPLTLAPSGKKLAPGEKMSVPVVVAPPFGAYPISVTVGAVYGVDGDKGLRFSNAHARIAPNDVVVPSVDRLLWRGDENDERRITVRAPEGVTVKEIKVKGEFAARLENGVIFVQPLPPKAGDVDQGPVAAIPVPPGVTLVPDKIAGRKSLAVGSIVLVLDPEPQYRVAPIGLSAQPKMQFVAAAPPLPPVPGATK